MRIAQYRCTIEQNQSIAGGDEHLDAIGQRPGGQMLRRCAFRCERAAVTMYEMLMDDGFAQIVAGQQQIEERRFAGALRTDNADNEEMRAGIV